ncbi:hypothetical protein [Photobacterium kishitanii]|uniref:Uncharacterized protein n=1 Tax=Photobacterium kishitanii TaxID=318456 RepID=A0A2T3KM11_9GAMM|nr:hypothetical protein [Photobacterium kishitanii]PSV00734.1 hypothetical protein C9J27_06220 [Photobacterium kishitanii]
MAISYKGEMISIYKLSKISGQPPSSLYRGYHRGIKTGEELITFARKHLIEFEGKWVSMKQVCKATNSNSGSIKRRLAAGIPIELAVLDSTERRGRNSITATLTPSEVIDIYTTLFNKNESQTHLAEQYGVHQSTISDIWRQKRWGWLTSPVRWDLENSKLAKI